MNKRTKSNNQNLVGRKNDPVFPTLSAVFPSKKIQIFDYLLTNNNILSFFRKNTPNQGGGYNFVFFLFIDESYWGECSLFRTFHLVLFGFIFNILIIIIASLYRGRK